MIANTDRSYLFLILFFLLAALGCETQPASEPEDGDALGEEDEPTTPADGDIHGGNVHPCFEDGFTCDGDWIVKCTDGRPEPMVDCSESGKICRHGACIFDDPDPDGDGSDADMEEDPPEEAESDGDTDPDVEDADEDADHFSCPCPQINGTFCFDPEARNPRRLSYIEIQFNPAECLLDVSFTTTDGGGWGGELACDPDGGAYFAVLGCSLFYDEVEEIVTVACEEGSYSFQWDLCEFPDGDLDGEEAEIEIEIIDAPDIPEVEIPEASEPEPDSDPDPDSDSEPDPDPDPEPESPEVVEEDPEIDEFA